MQTLPYILLSGTIIISGLLFFAFKKNNPRFLKLSLAFSGSYLFAITFLQLLPEVYSSNDSKTGIFILAGFMFQILLELFSEGIEHGHIHVHHKKHGAFPLALMISLCIHSFLEGMPLSFSLLDPHIGDRLLMGILLHHLPVAFALMSMLIASGVGKSKSIFLLVVFSLMAPAGAAFSSALNLHLVTDISFYFNRIMAVVIGIFLHISTTILFEADEAHRFNLYKTITILGGAALALL
jgi:zinc and cadmium transporter